MGLRNPSPGLSGIGTLPALTAANVAAGDLAVIDDVSVPQPTSIRADVLLDAVLRLSADGVVLPAVTPATITAGQNNYAAGVGPFQRWSSDAARTVTGMVAGAAGEIRLIRNVGTFPITLSNESASSTAANRFTNVGASDIVSGPNGFAIAVYDGTTSRWLVGKIRSDVGEGTFIVRQPGGVVGTDEVQVSHDGTAGKIEVKDGLLRVIDPNSSTNYLEVSFPNNIQVSLSGPQGTLNIVASATFRVKAASGGNPYYSFSIASGFSLRSDRGVLWSPTTDSDGAADIGIARAAAKVVKLTDGSSGDGWIQNNGGDKVTTADATEAVGTMTNLTALSVTVAAGRKYTFKMILYVADSVAADGLKFDFDGGTATMTDFRAAATVFDTALLLSQQTTAIATDFVVATVTGNGYVEVYGSFTVNAAGTFIPRYAQNAHTAGTLTVYRGSFLWVKDMP